MGQSGFSSYWTFDDILLPKTVGGFFLAVDDLAIKNHRERLQMKR